ncbi:hypothetical protein OY671_011345, partial [Metschnikowia pulcherrima]
MLGGEDGPQPSPLPFAVVAAPGDESLQRRQGIQGQGTFKPGEGREETFQRDDENSGQLEVGGFGEQAESGLGGSEFGQGLHQGLSQPGWLAIVQQVKQTGAAEGFRMAPRASTASRMRSSRTSVLRKAISGSAAALVRFSEKIRSAVRIFSGWP